MDKKKEKCRNPFLSRAGFDTAVKTQMYQKLQSRNPFLSRAGFDTNYFVPKIVPICLVALPF
jgi:hypothetical protein